jgi:hypothetical protein
MWFHKRTKSIHSKGDGEIRKFGSTGNSIQHTDGWNVFSRSILGAYSKTFGSRRYRVHRQKFHRITEITTISRLGVT